MREREREREREKADETKRQTEGERDRQTDREGESMRACMRKKQSVRAWKGECVRVNVLVCTVVGVCARARMRASVRALDMDSFNRNGSVSCKTCSLS